MKARLPVRRLPCLAFLIAALGAPLEAAAHSMAQVDAELRASERYAQLVDSEAPGFTLQDPDGRAVSLEGFSGKVVVLNFVYARCREICPLHSALIAKVQSLVAEVPEDVQKIQFVTVATDIEDAAETAALMREHGARHGLDPASWTFLHGGPGRERAGIALAKAYGLEFVPAADGDQMHAVVTHVIDPAGRLRARFHGLKFSSVRLMMYAAALAHGNHAMIESAVEDVTPGRVGDWRLQLTFGVVFAALAALVYGVRLRARRRQTEATGARSADYGGDTES